MNENGPMDPNTLAAFLLQDSYQKVCRCDNCRSKRVREQTPPFVGTVILMKDMRPGAGKCAIVAAQLERSATIRLLQDAIDKLRSEEGIGRSPLILPASFVKPGGLQ